MRQELTRRHYSLENVLRRWLQEPGVRLNYEGLVLAENHATDKITVTRSRNEVVALFIDQDTHLPVKKQFSIRDGEEDSTVYDNWKVVQGINTPRNVVTVRNGELISQYFLSKITYNTHPAESLFDPKVARVNPVKVD